MVCIITKYKVKFANPDIGWGLSRAQLLLGIQRTCSLLHVIKEWVFLIYDRGSKKKEQF